MRLIHRHALAPHINVRHARLRDGVTALRQWQKNGEGFGVGVDGLLSQSTGTIANASGGNRLKQFMAATPRKRREDAA